MGKTELLLILIVFFNLFSINAKSQDDPVQVLRNNTTQDKDAYFSKIYIDGMSANSSGFKILLRPYERRINENQFNPSIVNVKYGIINGEAIVFTDTIEQFSFFEPVELDGRWRIALKEGVNYTAFAQVFLYDNGRPVYVTTEYSGFTSANNAEITNIYADSIGSSMTIRGISMVPLDARASFVLKQNDRTLEEKETDTSAITSNDADKTIDVLWDKNLENGKYIVETKLVDKNRRVISSYDEVFEVKKTASNISTTSVSTTSLSATSIKTSPGTSGIELIILILVISLFYRSR